jgi:subtilase family serine protease
MKKLLGLSIIMVLALAFSGLATTSNSAQCATSNKKVAAKNAKRLPDLVVTTMEVQVGQGSMEGKMIVLYKISNQGNVTAETSKLQVKMYSDNPNVIVTQQVPALSPNGGTYSGKAVYTMGKNGKYTFKAVADYNNNIYERNDINNVNTLSFSIGR